MYQKTPERKLFSRKWNEIVNPEVVSFRTSWFNIIKEVVKEIGDLQQGRDLNIPINARTRDLLGTLELKSLAKISQACYFYGHWKPGSVQPDIISRHSWKISNVCNQILREAFYRNNLKIHNGRFRVTFSSRDCWLWEEFGLATRENFDVFLKCGYDFGRDEIKESAEKLKHDCPDKMWDTSKYHIHDEKTGFDDEEAVEEINKVGYNSVKIIPCNFKVKNYSEGHPFMIGRKHFEKNSIYLDPKSAPCCKCNQPFSDHTNERAILFHEDDIQPKGTIEWINKILRGISVKKVQHIAYIKDDKS